MQVADGVEPGSAGSPGLAWKVVPWVISLAAVAAWVLPVRQPNAVFGRLDYLQFWSAVILTAAAVSVWVVALAPAPRRRFLGFQICAIWLGLTVAVGAAELLAFVLPIRSVMDNSFFLSKKSGQQRTPELPFERPAHLKWEGSSRGDLARMLDDDDPDARPITFQTDQDGFRNSQDITQADLVMIGDSFTEAGNVPDQEIFSTLVQNRLGLKMRNLGRAGYTAATELIVLKKFGLPCRPKIVVWQVAESNDLWESRVYANWVADGRPDYFLFTNDKGMGSSGGWRERSPTFRLFSLLRHREPSAYPFQGLFRDDRGREHLVRFLTAMGLLESARETPYWESFSSAIAEAAALCRSNHIRFLVVLMPDKYRVMGPHTELPEPVVRRIAAMPGVPADSSVQAMLGPFCASNDIPYLDCTPELCARAMAGELVYQPMDTHLSSRGHQIVADLIARRLEESRH
ncbi:MAG TPA: hypothetical protein VMJ12_04580 [Candidatus Acidoferrales bacterium]|nr:hypothetical protein [Candidatus Acidoferrales bacterium]